MMLLVLKKQRYSKDDDDDDPLHISFFVFCKVEAHPSPLAK